VEFDGYKTLIDAYLQDDVNQFITLDSCKKEAAGAIFKAKSQWLICLYFDLFVAIKKGIYAKNGW